MSLARALGLLGLCLSSMLACGGARRDTTATPPTGKPATNAASSSSAPASSASGSVAAATPPPPKPTPTGARRLTRVFDVEGNFSDVAVDAAGDLVVVGEVEGGGYLGSVAFAAADHDAIVAKLSPTGDVVWAALFGGAVRDAAIGVAVDAGGDVFVTGTFGDDRFTRASDLRIRFGATTLARPPEAVTGTFVARLDGRDGAAKWAETFADDTTGAGSCGRVTVGPRGELAVTCNFMGGLAIPMASGKQPSGSVGSTDCVVVRLDPATGAALWSTLLGGDSPDRCDAIAFDGGGDVFVAGVAGSSPLRAGRFTLSHTGDAAMANGFVAKLAGGDGTVTWARALGPPTGGRGSAHATGLAVDAKGDAVVTGGFSGALKLHEVASSAPLGELDLFVAGFDGKTGEARWQKTFGSPATDASHRVASDRWGDLIVLDTLRANATIDGFALLGADASKGVETPFVLKLSPPAAVAGSPATLFARRSHDDFVTSAELHGLAIAPSGAIVVAGGFVRAPADDAEAPPPRKKGRLCVPIVEVFDP
jgi:hypothetical protein